MIDFPFAPWTRCPGAQETALSYSSRDKFHRFYLKEDYRGNKKFLADKGKNIAGIRWKWHFIGGDYYSTKDRSRNSYERVEAL